MGLWTLLLTNSYTVWRMEDDNAISIPPNCKQPQGIGPEKYIFVFKRHKNEDIMMPVNTNK